MHKRLRSDVQMYNFVQILNVTSTRTDCQINSPQRPYLTFAFRLSICMGGCKKLEYLFQKVTYTFCEKMFDFSFTRRDAKTRSHLCLQERINSELNYGNLHQKHTNKQTNKQLCKYVIQTRIVAFVSG